MDSKSPTCGSERATWPNWPRSAAGSNAPSSVVTTDSTCESPMNVVSHGCGKDHCPRAVSILSKAAKRLR